MEEKSGYPLSGGGFLGRTEDYPLRKSVVDHDQQRVEALGRRKIGDEIARDLLKQAGARGGNRDKGWGGGMGIGFCLLARATTLDVFAYKLYKTWPPIVGGHELAGVQESRMSCGGVIMVLCDNGASEIVGGGNIHATLIGEEIVAHLKVGEAGSEMGGDIVMKGL